MTHVWVKRFPPSVVISGCVEDSVRVWDPSVRKVFVVRKSGFQKCQIVRFALSVYKISQWAPSKHPTGVQNPTFTLKIQVRSKGKIKNSHILSRCSIKTKMFKWNRLKSLDRQVVASLLSHMPWNTVNNSVANILLHTHTLTHTTLLPLI